MIFNLMRSRLYRKNKVYFDTDKLESYNRPHFNKFYLQINFKLSGSQPLMLDALKTLSVLPISKFDVYIFYKQMVFRVVI